MGVLSGRQRDGATDLIRLQRSLLGRNVQHRVVLHVAPDHTSDLTVAGAQQNNTTKAPSWADGTVAASDSVTRANCQDGAGRAGRQANGAATSDDEAMQALDWLQSALKGRC